jgi:hypothetical protein
MWIVYKGKLIGVDRETAKKLLSPSKIATTAGLVDADSKAAKSNVPKFSFYKKGEYFFMGKKGQEELLKQTKGLVIIHLLVRHEREPLPAMTLNLCDKSMLCDIAVPLRSVHDPSDEAPPFLTKPVYQPVRDGLYISDINRRI